MAMVSSIPSIKAQLHVRRVVPHRSTPSYGPSHSAAATRPEHDGGAAPGTLTSNVILVLSILLCAVICAIAANAIVQCMLRLSKKIWFDDDDLDAGGAAQPPPCVTSPGRTAMVKGLPVLLYSTMARIPGSSGSECAICISEFAPRDRVRVLPGCNHGFHVACVDRWLASHSSCPTCRRCPLGGVARRDPVGTLGGPPRSAVVPFDVESVVIDHHHHHHQDCRH